MGGQLHSPAALPLVPTGKEPGWAPELVWTLWQGEKTQPLPGIKLQLSSPQPEHYID